MIEKLKFYCQKVLPLVYDDSLSYFEVLCHVTSKINEIIASNENLVQEWKEFEKAFSTDLSETVNNILTNWKNDGTLEQIIGDTLDNITVKIEENKTEISNISKKLTANEEKTSFILIKESNTDITSLLNEKLQNYENVLVLGDKYIISDTIVIPNGHSLIGNNTTLEATNSINVILKVGDNIETEYNRSKQTIVKNFIIKAKTLNTDIGVEINTIETIIESIKCVDCRIGFCVFPIDNEKHYVSNAKITNCIATTSIDPMTTFNCGIEINGTDNIISNFTSIGSLIGIKFNTGGGDLLSNIHLTSCDSTVIGWTDSVGISCPANKNIFITNLYCDNFRIGVESYNPIEIVNYYCYHWETKKSAERIAYHSLFSHVNVQNYFFSDTVDTALKIDRIDPYSFTFCHFTRNTYQSHTLYKYNDDSNICSLNKINEYHVYARENVNKEEVIFAFLKYYEGKLCNGIYDIISNNFIIKGLIYSLDLGKVIDKGQIIFFDDNTTQVDVNIYYNETTKYYYMTVKEVTTNTYWSNSSLTVTCQGVSPVFVHRDYYALSKPTGFTKYGSTLSYTK